MWATESARNTRAGLPAGSCGTVQSVFLSVEGVYEVLFEGAQTRRIVFQPDLDLIPSARSVAEVDGAY
jgi:hypothetical protein